MAYVRYCLVVFALACTPKKASVDASFACKANGSTCTPGGDDPLSCDVCINNVCACAPAGTVCGLDDEHCCNGCDFNAGVCK
jgi:hypothetical protein